MLTQAARFKVYQLLQAISENEEIVEEQRQQLAKQHGFEPWAAFKRIDRMSLGKISAYDINQFLQDNMVDYISETECFHMFTYFDKDEDGFLDFQDFLQLVLPLNNVGLRAKVSQRLNYQVGGNDRLQTNVEFELSRLFEKEIHYHVKIEGEKKALEALEEFNTVSIFTVIDQRNYGFLDFENIKNYLFKYKQEILKEDVNAIMRRLSDQPDGKISFREFSLAITPNLVGLSNEALKDVEFGVKEKQRLAIIEQNKSFTHPLESSKAKQSLRSFHHIQAQGHDSPVRNEFKKLSLKQKFDPNRSYFQDTGRIKSPSLDARNHRVHSRKVLQTVNDSPVLHNNVQGRDTPFDQNWEESAHGRIYRQKSSQEDLHNSQQWAQSQSQSQSPPAQFGQSQIKTSVWDQKPKSVSRERTPQQVPKTDGQFMPQFDKSENPKRRINMGNGGATQGAANRGHTTIQNLLTVISKQEMDLEKLRQRLVGESTEFNTIDAFRKLDAEARGEVTVEQLQHALEGEMGVEFDVMAIDLFFLHFDKDQKGALKYSEFCDAFVPKSQQCQQELQGRKASNLKNSKSYEQMFSEHTRMLYRALWEQLLHTEVVVEQERQLLLQNTNFDIQKAFNLFEGTNSDGENNGFVTRDDLSRTLMLPDPDIDILFHKFNRRHSGVISYAEFIEEVSPKGPLL